MKNLLSLLMFVGCSISISAQDTVYFFSGERAVGELKSLDMGKLKFDSDDMGVVSIDWEDVASLQTKGLFEITLKDRTKHFGNFAAGDTAGQIVMLKENGDRETLDPMTIVSIGELETSFWAKIDGKLDAGLSYTKASDVLQYNGSARISYRGKKWFTQLQGGFVITEQETKPTARKSNINYDLRYSVIKRWFVGTGLGVEQNSELGLDLRYTGGLSIGNDFVYTNIHKLYGQVGAIANQERPLDSADFKSSAEGFISAGYLLYNSGVRDFYLEITANVFPSFTVADRIRGEFNVNPKIEIIDDLDFGLQYYYIFDTKPLVSTASSEDWGILTTLSYSF